METVEQILETHRLKMAANDSSRENLNIVVAPLHHDFLMAYGAATKFAEQGIKAGFILNGGALILFSGFATLFKVNPINLVVICVIIALAFIVGLVSSCVTCYFAYRGARAEIQVAKIQIGISTVQHLLSSQHLLASQAMVTDTKLADSPDIPQWQRYSRHFSRQAEHSVKWELFSVQ